MKPKLKIHRNPVIDVDDWNRFIEDTYGITYNFQQQDGCKDRGTESFIASKTKYESYKSDSVPFRVNGNKMGVSLDAWLKMDRETVKINLPANEKQEYRIDLFFERNFYPHIEELASDLCKKGLLEEGEYTINIDW